ncbi:DnaD domain protein [Clostridium sp. Sa3CUN1]|uniref:DnaD domain protein n=1 Tax=Clostridium gallinarum TaxID=2762246 RepID=A0ABR8Q753_9CLOT|nr:DnaD domain protein [Clostridium gallinarum]MBD7916240.1 DnaD domain protein [Clostridium gallinarum]
MSTFMFRSKPLKFTPVSNVFIERYMPKARGEFIKVYLLMLKYNFTGEPGVNSTVLATTLNLLESDIINALNYWNEEGIIKLLPIDNMGNFHIEFIDLSEEGTSNVDKFNLVEELTDNSNGYMLKDIGKLLGRTLSPSEVETYIGWKKDFKFSSELILILIEYCASKGKTNFRYIEKVAIAWNEMNIKTVDDAQNYIRKTEDKWGTYREILKFLGIRNTDIMKPQEDLLEKWTSTYGYSLEVIKKACDICFQRLNRADFKYIDGILSSWNKDKLKTLEDIEKKEANFKNSSNKKAFNNSKNNNKPKLRFDNFKGREYDYDDLEKKLLGWDTDD